ncbi:MAG: hypothetical protein IPJ07_13255 [Acidobacteria bacterium]|nr:hypothetical protein [Acidobacteriota bacterium]
MMLLNPDSDIRAQPRYEGCTLSAEAGREQMTGLFTSSGNTRLDQAFNQEYAWLTGVFGVRPSLFMYEDSDGPNAKAMPVSYKPGQFQGTVIFGINLLRSEFERNPVNFTIPAILAHEFGHIIQFTGRIQLTGKLIELHADYIAGWYMKHRDTAWSEISIRQSMDGFYRIGDYDFNSPLHHGTPDERLNAFLGGVRDSSSNVAAMVRNGSQFVTQNFGGGGTIGPSTGGSARSTRTETDEEILSAIRRIVRESSSNFRGIRGERGILDNER